jgi:hypothetical protein
MNIAFVVTWTSLTQNESHQCHCSLFSIERRFPTAKGASRTRRCELALREFNLRVSRSSRKVTKISRAFARLSMTGSGEDRTSSGEVEADKLAGLAHALLSE